jgi:hypothetical protein
MSGRRIAPSKPGGFYTPRKKGMEVRTFAILGIAVCSVAGLTFGATYSGRLMDADCYNTNKVSTQESGNKTYKSPITKTCAPTAATTNFAVRITGSAYGGYVGNTIKLDNSGNAQAASELQNGQLKTGRNGTVHVIVSGKLQGETLVSASVKPTRKHGSS